MLINKTSTQPWDAIPDIPFTRSETLHLPPTEEHSQFILQSNDRSFKHQYSNIYFLRLHTLRPFVQENAKKKWDEAAGNPHFVPRVLDVEKGQLCYVIGTVYMDMPLKPNVLDDIARDHAIQYPSIEEKYVSDDDATMLEDESGRIHLIGDCLKSARLVTGVILGALGIETSSGDFEVVDICFAGMTPKPSLKGQIGEIGVNLMDVDDAGASQEDEWIAVVSGMEVSDTTGSDTQLHMLREYLTGEAGGFEEQAESGRISRLIIAGNSLAPMTIEVDDTEKKQRGRYGQETSSFTPHPILTLSSHLADLARSIPIHLLPGATDPTGSILPQQPFPRAMFGTVASYASFSCETNPTYLHIGASATPGQPLPPYDASESTSDMTSLFGRTILVHSGQPLDDMFRYLPSPPATRLGMATSTLRWRHLAPTAPDTLWCHPYLKSEPFVIQATPDLYIIGNQPEFKTRLVVEASTHQDVEPDELEESGHRCRIVLVPKFKDSGILVLINLRTLAVRTIQLLVDEELSIPADQESQDT